MKQLIQSFAFLYLAALVNSGCTNASLNQQQAIRDTIYVKKKSIANT